MMFWWVFLACKYNKLFKYGLLPLVKKNPELAYALWFECELQKNPQTFKLLQQVQKSMYNSSAVRTDIFKSKRLCELLIKLARSPSQKHCHHAFYDVWRHKIAVESQIHRYGHF